MSSKDLVQNRKALHNFEIVETLEVGIVLRGTEVKSLKDNGGSLQEAYVRAMNGALYLVGSHIAHYAFGNLNNHEERRDRKLLLHKREFIHLQQSVQIKGMAIVPLGLYLKKGLIKLKIALGKGKKSVDKRHALMAREKKREMDRAMKHYR